MPRLIYVDPNNPKNQVITTQLGLNVPAGYLLANTSDGSWQGVDGLTDKDMQTFVGGLASGGYPTYWGYSDKPDPKLPSPNGILGGGTV